MGVRAGRGQRRDTRSPARKPPPAGECGRRMLQRQTARAVYIMITMPSLPPLPKRGFTTLLKMDPKR